MSTCSLNTDCHLDDLVSAIQDVKDAYEEDVLIQSDYSRRFFNVHYPRLSDAISDAVTLLEMIEDKDVRNRPVPSLPAEVHRRRRAA